MGPPARKSVPSWNGNPRNRSILVRGGKEIKRDALSKGDRRGHRANRIRPCKGVEMWCSDSGTSYLANSKSPGTGLQRGGQTRRGTRGGRFGVFRVACAG